MSLSNGDRLGPYEIVAPLGAGGMGEVYKARDTRLDRSVAIKVLPDHIATRDDARARFEREARAVAGLNHPNICTLHDSGPNYMVMELIEGDTLAARIEKGPIPLPQALAWAAQIADALDRAHRAGVSHRDVKPQNIMVTRDGVKVLDFGLAKAAPSSSGTTAATLTQAITVEGTLVGTPQYMAPEQFEGREADARTDIWAFGAVLYEMVTARKAFEGKSYASLVGAILSMDPPPMAVQPLAPAWLERLVRRCLQKDPEDRYQSMRDVVLELKSPPTESAPASAPGPAPAKSARWPWAVAAASLALAGFLALKFLSSAAPAAPARLSIALPPGFEITSYPAITRDGRTVAYAARQGIADPRLYLRSLDSFDSREVPGSTGARQPFFSPDGKWVAFFSQGQLLKAELAGGAPVRLADAAYPFGGTWTDDNQIIFTTGLGSGLQRMPAAGGAAEALTKPDGEAKGYAHVFPQALPGGSIVFSVWGRDQGAALLSPKPGVATWTRLLPDTSFSGGVAHLLPDKRALLFAIQPDFSVKAAPFDPARPALTSADTSLLAGVYADPENDAQAWLASAPNGTVVYAAANPANMSLVFVDREGRAEPVVKEQQPFREVSLSPDGSMAVIRRHLELWVRDLARGSSTRLTAPGSSNNWAVWADGGRSVLFASNRGGNWDIYSQPADGSRPAQVLLKRPADQFPVSLAPDGTLLFAEITSTTGRDLWTLAPGGQPAPLRVTPFNEWAAQFAPAPSGAAPRWIAYCSDESGVSEVYVQSYPGGANRTAVSSGGGLGPRWSRDGKELYYLASDALMAVAVRPDGTFGAPRRLFDRSNYFSKSNFNSYDTSPDGQRFLMIQRDPGAVPRQLNVILNWSAELAKAARR